ncbi:hypothetical protein ACQVPJ_24085 [Bacillus mycoides]|uniref:hypothetical protein n=1 Tax=Bacillus mycoides TaxID=1405 RepID=UPI003D6612CA
MCEVYTETRYFNRAECLVCGHQEKVYRQSKEEYQEVTVCPKCNGAFVDMWVINKYKQNTTQQCEHKYRLMDSETTRAHADNRQVSIGVFGSFYCEKCLDIQIRGKVEEGGR